MATAVPNHKGPMGQRNTTTRKTVEKKQPGKEVVKSNAPKCAFATEAKAEAHTKKITTHRNETIRLVIEAHEGFIWLAYKNKDGSQKYPTWKAYLDDKFHGAPIELPVTQRRLAAWQLAKAGLSRQAIADTTGVSKATASGDVASGVQNLNPSTDDEPELGEDSNKPELGENGEPIYDGELVPDDELPASIRGFDKKNYQQPTTSKAPKPVDVVAEAGKLAKRIETLIGAIDALYDEKGGADNEDVDRVLAQQVSYFIAMAVDRGLTPRLEEVPALTNSA